MRSVAVAVTVLLANFATFVFASSKILSYPNSPTRNDDDLSEMVRPHDVPFEGPDQYGEISSG